MLVGDKDPLEACNSTERDGRMCVKNATMSQQQFRNEVLVVFVEKGATRCCPE